MTMRGGRFDATDDVRFTALNDSLPVDRRLVREDVEGSIAWAGALREAGVPSRLLVFRQIHQSMVLALARDGQAPSEALLTFVRETSCGARRTRPASLSPVP